MISGELETKIKFDEAKDRERIENARSVLTEIRLAFQNTGGYTSTEQETLSHAAYILSNILDGETF